MTIALVGTLGGANTLNLSRSLSLTTTTAATVGNLVVVAVAKDNGSATDGLNTTEEVSHIADSAGNGWWKAAEYCNANAAPGAGAVVAVWASMLGHAMPIGTIITATTDYVASKAMGAAAFSLASMYEAYLAIAAGGSGTDGAALASLSSGVISTTADTLFFRAAALEGTRAAPTPTASWATVMDYYATDMWLFAEFRIYSNNVGASAPAAGGAGNDTASLHCALRERLVSNQLFRGAPL